MSNDNPFESPIPAGAAPVAARPATSGLAITSMVLGILSLVFSIITAIPAIICGIIALVRINKSGGQLAGTGYAVAGITTGAIGTILIGGCIALLLPAVQAAREAARVNQSMNNMKQVSLAMMSYESSYSAFPAAGGGTGLSWRVHILPYCDQDALYQQFHLDEPWDSEHNLSLLEQMPEFYRSPNSTAPAGHTVYLAVTGPGTAFRGPQGPRFQDIRDGASNTLMLVEADDELAVPWTKPDDWAFDPSNPTAGLGGLRNYTWLGGFFDGHVERFPNDMPARSVTAAMTSDAGD